MSSDKGKSINFLAAEGPKSSLITSSKQGFIKFPPLLYDFLHLAIQNATI